MTRARWTPAARNDLSKIDDFHALTAPGYADEVGRAAIAADRFLADHPAVGAKVSSEWRRWRVAKTPYLPFYRITPGGVEILRVFRDRQDRPF